MANGQEVGKISIRVIPNLKRFYAELKGGLEAAERGNKVEVDVEADLKKFRAEVAAATKKLPDAEIDVSANTKGLRKQLARAADGADAIDLNINSRKIRRQLDLLNLAFERRTDQTLGKRKIDVQAPYELERRLSSMDLNWDRKVRKFLEQTTHQIKLEPDLDFDYRLRKRLAKFKPTPIKLELDPEFDYKLRKRLEKFRPQPVKIELDVDPAATYRLRQRVAKIKPKVKVDVDVDRNVLARLGNRIGNSLGKLDAPNFGTGINPMGYAVILGLIAALSPLIAGVLGAVTTGLMALPGLITAVAVPIGAMMLGLDGLKKAAERLKGPFDDLKKSMSTAVENQFGPVFDKLGAVFPTLKAALPTVTQGLADMAKAFADTVTSPKNLELVDRVIRRIGDGLREAAPGVAAFTEGILRLVDNFSERFPNMGKWFSDTGESFSKWVDDFTKKGPDGTSKFDKALDSLRDTLGILGDGLVDMGKKALDFFSDPEAVKSFKTELDGLVNTLTTIHDLINGISTAMSKIPGFSDGEANSPFDFAPIQLQLMKEAFDNFDWSTVWNGFKTAAATAMANLTILAVNTANGVVNAFRGVGDQLSTVWNSAITGAQAAFSAVVSAARSAVADVVAEFVSAGVQVMAEVATWPGRIAGAVGDLSGVLVEAGRALLRGLKKGMEDALGDVLVFAGKIAARIAAVKGPIPHDRRVLTPNGEALMEGLQTGLETGFESVLELAKDMAGRISQAFDEGIDLSNMLGGDKLPDLQKTLDTIEQEKKRLKVEKNAATDKESKKALQNQIDQLQAQKDQLSYQKDRIKNEDKYGESIGSNQDSLQKFFDIPKGWVDATASQMLTDLGGSGNGMIPSLIRQGAGIGEQFIFNVSSMDEALAGQQNITNKKALQYKSR